MKFAPDLMDEFARPRGCLSSADASSKAAELTARRPSTNWHPSPAPSRLVLGTSDPLAGRCVGHDARSARRQEPGVAGRDRGVDPHVSASLFAPTLHGKRRRCRNGCRCADTAVDAIAFGSGGSLRAQPLGELGDVGSCSRAGYGKAPLRHGSAGSSPVVP